MLLYNFFYVLYGWQNILIMICGLPLSSGTCAPSLISLIVISFNNSITTLSINIVEKFEIKFVWCAGYESELPRRRSGFDPGCILLFYFVFFENSLILLFFKLNGTYTVVIVHTYVLILQMISNQNCDDVKW